MSLDEHTRRITIPSSGGSGTLVLVVRELDDADIHIDDIALRRPTLDDVFLELTGHAAEETPPDPEGARAPAASAKPEAAT